MVGWVVHTQPLAVSRSSLDAAGSLLLTPDERRGYPDNSNINTKQRPAGLSSACTVSVEPWSLQQLYGFDSNDEDEGKG